MIFTITFDHLPLPINMNSRSHWSVKSEAAQLAREEMAEAASGLMIPQGLDAVRLDFHFYLPDLRQRDLENLRASCKPYVDYLCPSKQVGRYWRPGMGIILDDNVKVVQEERLTWEYRKGEPGFSINIVDISGEIGEPNHGLMEGAK